MPKLVVHVSHESVEIPEEFTASPAEVEAEATVSADLYMELIVRQAWPHAEIVCAEFSRRSTREVAQVGRGVIYTHDHLHRTI